MATESPVRLLGTSEARNWMDSSNFTSNVTAQDLGLLINSDRMQGNNKVAILNRSGSAPPSVDGSLTSLRNLISHPNLSSQRSFEDLSNIREGCESEAQVCADPAYLAYYFSNVNLNPRLPQPLVSQGTRRLVHHMGGIGDNWRLPSSDDSSRSSLFSACHTLSAHNEEPEDDDSPKIFSDIIDKNHSAQFSSKIRRKSPLDLIQEDFPRTPSPVYHNQLRTSIHGTVEEADLDVNVNPSIDSSAKVPKTARIVLGSSPVIGVHSVDSVPNNNLVPVSAPCLSSTNTSVSHLGFSGGISINESNLGCSDPASGELSSHTSVGESEARNPWISHNNHRGQHAHPYVQKNVSSRKVSSQNQIGQPHAILQATRRTQNAMDAIPHSPGKLVSAEAQPMLQSACVASPLYSTAASYVMPYPNLQPSSLYAPQYSVGGYSLPSQITPPFMAGYSSQGSISVPLENANMNFGPRISGIVAGGSIPPGVDWQHFYRFYGQLGVSLQPSFPDLLYMPYFLHPSLDAHGGAGQYDRMISRGVAVGSIPEIVDSQEGSVPSLSSADQRPQFPRVGGVNNHSARKVGTLSPSYYGSTPGIGFVMQYPTSPLGSPVYQGPRVSGMGYSGRRDDNVRSPFSNGRSMAAHPVWQGQRGRERIDDIKSLSFLEELKASKGRRFELSEIAGRIVEFSADQHGSRFIQKKLENCCPEEKASVFEEVIPHASTLMTDVFGNYVIQKFFEHGSPDQRKKFADKLVGHVLPLSLQMYGCRVIQKALEVIELDQKTMLVKELDGHVLRCVRDQNGNHVIQKCIECVPAEKIDFIISAFRGHVMTLSTHPYGCRVIQRVLEYCTDEPQSLCIVDEILQSAYVLAQDRYGNYVTQHVLERGKPHERSQIIEKLAGQIVHMSQNKFASNVIEKCLQYGDNAERGLLIEEIVEQTEGNDNLLMMMKDQFGNYVVQKILETCAEHQKVVLLDRIRVHTPALKKYTYGKHIVARVELLGGEEAQPLES